MTWKEYFDEKGIDIESDMDIESIVKEKETEEDKPGEETVKQESELKKSVDELIKVNRELALQGKQQENVRIKTVEENIDAMLKDFF